jgi:citrate lyase subunit beta/citryl-CoA lyase
MIRSLLFAPGNVPRRVEKALGLDADAVILDLEDSVAVSDKVATRGPVAEAVKRPHRGLVYVRINAPSTPFCHDDLAQTVQPGLDGVVVPKLRARQACMPSTGCSRTSSASAASPKARST